MFNFFSNRRTRHSANGWSVIYSDTGRLFRYAFIDRGSYIDIAIQTPKSPRDAAENENYHLTHKLPLSEGSDLTKICFNSGKEPKTIEKAEQILKEYINLYATWLDTSKTIDQQIKERNN